jgi:lipopolysaccharide transport system ATP-binding protein
VIRVEGLWKEYTLGVRTAAAGSLREAIASAFTAPVRRLRRLRGLVPDEERFWALRDVTFEVDAGEVVGIIGGNGAGKSTLLKILSRIVAPTRGRASVRGRVASLLEVGTGFHPELTGRENIFLNGAILGMTRHEVLNKFDAIVAFAEVERFLDTPVKRYSSGMYVRLAFSVAAHLDPEVLIVDEVLAVGDASFQARCLGKIGEVAKGGRTVLFVSHNTRAVVEFCDRAIWVQEGQIRLQAQPREAVQAYLGLNTTTTGKWARPVSAASSGTVDILSARVVCERGVELAVVEADRPWFVEVRYRVCDAVRDCAVLARFITADGTIVLTSWDTDSDAAREPRQPGSYWTRCKLPPHLLRPGKYSVAIGAYSYRVGLLDFWQDAFSLEVSRVGYQLNDDRQGVVTPILEWTRGSETGMPPSPAPSVNKGGDRFPRGLESAKANLE